VTMQPPSGAYAVMLDGEVVVFVGDSYPLFTFDPGDYLPSTERRHAEALAAWLLAAIPKEGARELEEGVETRAREDGGRWVVEQRDVLRGPWREVTT